VAEAKRLSMDDVQALVVIPTIPGRDALLKRACKSIREDVLVAGAIEVDTDGKGPAAMRNLAVVNSLNAGLRPPWIAFLDDDDEFDPGHVQALIEHADATGADVVYPWFHLNVGGVLDNSRDPLGAEGRPFDPERLLSANFVPVTALVRTDLFVQAGGFPEPNSETWPHPDCEDWALWLRLLGLGAKFEHLNRRTWTWHWHGRNTSGRPDRAAQIYGGTA